MLALIAMTLLTAPAGSSGVCTGTVSWSHCDANVADGTVDLYGAYGTRGDHNQAFDADALADDRSESGSGSKECDSPLNRCGTYEVVMRQEATLTDVASFAPRLAPPIPEPDGVGIAGLPVNVVASARTHTRTGELFDLPVTVRFRPVSFSFDYGDGTTRESRTGGATWQQLGLSQFTATATSHAFRERGEYIITTVVHFAADVDFGTGWIPVEGLLAVPAGATTVEILEARTALVERTCHEDPNGIGC